jgi:hypothetical protein
MGFNHGPCCRSGDGQNADQTEHQNARRRMDGGEGRGTLCHFLDPIKYQAARDEDFFHKALFFFSKRNRNIKHDIKMSHLPQARLADDRREPLVSLVVLSYCRVVLCLWCLCCVVLPCLVSIDLSMYLVMMRNKYVIDGQTSFFVYNDWWMPAGGSEKYCV